METIEEFLLKANSFHPTIKFTAEISETEMTSWTQVYKGDQLLKESTSLMCEHISNLQRLFNT